MSPGGETLSQVDERLVVELGTAFHQRAVYPAGHPQVQRSLDRSHRALLDWLAAMGADEVSLLIVDDQLVLDRRPLPEDALWRAGLVSAFAKHSLGGLTLRAGLTPEELGRFLDSCHAPSGPVSSRHLHHGRTKLRDGAGGEALAPAAEGGVEGELADAPSLARELADAGSGNASRVERLRGLVARLARSASATRIDPATLAAARIADRSLRHGLETALGALRLGRSLGVSTDVLEELGLAGLLHDVGYLDPAAAGESFEQRRREHAVRGALRLAAMEGVPESVVLVAYEHHLRWDGTENYPRLSAPRRPAAPARVVAVADTWSTLRSNAGVTAAEAATLLRDRAGSFLDPELVERFLAGLG